MKFRRSFLAVLAAVLCMVQETEAQIRTPDQPQDSLTLALCANQEQIVSRRTGDFKIDYYMGETQLNMKTMSGFLSLNNASLPYYRKFRVHRVGGIGIIAAGIGLIVADSFIPKPDFPMYTFAGIATAIGGFTVIVGANDKFRLAIYHYNKDICKIK